MFHNLKRILASLALLTLTGGSAAAGFVEGIDISHWQGTIDWTSVKTSGIDFAFMKATQGNSYVDPTFQTNIQNATAAGVLVGPYHFCDVDTDIGNPLDPVNEANHFLSQIEPYYDTGLYLPPVADVEGLPDFPTIAEERAFISNWVQTFSDTINDALGVRPIIYTSKWGANTYYTPEVATAHYLWLAWWKGTGTSNPPIPSDTPLWNDWKFWQYSSTGSVPGIGGDVDLDVFDGTLEQLEQLAIGSDPGDLVSIANFDADEGYFKWAIDYSGQTTGVGPDSHAIRVTSQSQAGSGSQELFIDGDPGGWLVRHLSGSASPPSSPATNLALDATGSIGFWLKTNNTGLTVQIAIDDPGTAERGLAQSVQDDGQWHLYEWDLEDDDQWQGWFNGDGTITGPTITLDSIFFAGAGDATIYLDSVAHNPLGSLLPLPGDFNGDGNLDEEDLAIWQLNFGTPSGATADQGDADRDTDVDGADFLHWQIGVSSNTGQSIASVPEPASLALLVLTTMLLSSTSNQSGANRGPGQSAIGAGNRGQSGGGNRGRLLTLDTLVRVDLQCKSL